MAELTMDTIADLNRKDKAESIVKRYSVYSIGTGLLPFPLLDMAALAGVQVKMIQEISQEYGETLSNNVGKSVITTLVATIAPASMARGALGSIIKSVPFVGSILGMVAFPVFCSASSYALGMVFVAHYESGGTFLTFKASDWKDEFKSAFQRKKEETESEGPKSAEMEDTISALKKRIEELEKKKA